MGCILAALDGTETSDLACQAARDGDADLGDTTGLDRATAETPDRERLDELQRCFECGASIPPEGEHGAAVTEGIVLCPACCARAEDERDGPATVRLPPTWFEDLAGERHHT